MNHVTIKELYWEISEDKYGDKVNNVWEDYKDIEVVPRKMVEMIIERCKKDFCSRTNDGSMCYEASCIKDYAESLLKQFDEEDENIHSPIDLPFD